jgi:RimJ/RimL family protein N-acetyltransferase
VQPNQQDPLSISLVVVDGSVLAELVSVAKSSATAGDVTPALTAGDDWSPQRVAWLEEFHRGRRGGLDGPEGEATWAVVSEARVVGSVRLKARPEPHVVETGIWLARSVRGRGLGRQAVAAVLERAAAAGAHEVRAETTSRNNAAQRLPRSLGFELAAGEDDSVHGRRELEGYNRR